MKRLRLLNRTLATVACVALVGLADSAAFAQAERGDGARGDRRAERGNQRGDRGDRANRGGRRGGMGGGMMAGGMMGGPGMGAIGRMMRPDFYRRDLQLFVERLELDSDQATIIEAILNDYESSFELTLEEYREEFDRLRFGDEAPEIREEREAIGNEMREMFTSFRQMRENGGDIDPDQMRTMRERGRELRDRMRELTPDLPEGDDLVAMFDEIERIAGRWRQDRRQLRDTFGGDIELLLDDVQLEAYPEAMRFIRRDRLVENGEISGESVDLFVLAGETAIASEATVLDLLSQYSLELDAALQQRERFLEDNQLTTIRAFMTNEFDAALRAAEREAALRVAVRSVNDQFSDLIHATLSETDDAARADAFGEAYRMRAYRRIYTPTIMQRSFAIAAEFDDLADATRDLMEQMNASYEAELQQLNGELLMLTRMTEPNRSRERLERRMNNEARGRGEDRDDPLRDAYDRRTELDRRYRAELESGLTEEQIEQLPRMRERRQNRGERGGDDARGRRGEMTEEERAERRARFIERFDSDGDGELSEDERREAFRQLREERGNRGRGGGGGGGGGGDGARRGGGQRGGGDDT